MLTEGLFESEVFGHERGAFTGSQGRKTGLFELASGGTLFLDEVGELPPAMQAKLLRVLETGEFRRVGGIQVLYADVRVVCATNRDLLREVDEGRFREDLYYRIAGIVVHLPRLRERREDIRVLAEAILDRINRSRLTRYRLSDSALEWLERQEFPGNVRELRNLIQAACAASHENIVDSVHLHKLHGTNGFARRTRDRSEERPQETSPEIRAMLGRETALIEIESRHIQGLLRRYGGNRRKVAEQLGISVRTLYRKLKKYELD